MADITALNILLVDDDPMVIRVLSRILKHHASLRFATSGRAALEQCRASVPDLVVLDVEMPDLTGFDVYKAMKREPPLAGVPVILITSHRSPQLSAMARELGALDFIVKPPEPSRVLAAIRAHFAPAARDAANG